MACRCEVTSSGGSMCWECRTNQTYETRYNEWATNRNRQDAATIRNLCTLVSKMKATLRRRERKITKLRRLLESVSEIHQSSNHSSECPFCHDRTGHSVDCEAFDVDGKVKV